MNLFNKTKKNKPCKHLKVDLFSTHNTAHYAPDGSQADDYVFGIYVCKTCGYTYKERIKNKQ